MVNIKRSERKYQGPLTYDGKEPERRGAIRAGYHCTNPLDVMKAE
jgi:hypothetical protein